MKIKVIQSVRVPSLLVAAALQVLPLARTMMPAAGAASNALAIIFRWTVGAAVIGTVDAVSGASTVITTPLNTNINQGQTWTVPLTTAPHIAYYWQATGLPAGLALSGQGGYPSWKITGTPTVSGTFNVALKASDSYGFPASTTCSGTMVINIAASGNSPPTISSPPASQTVTQAQTATFTVGVGGQGPFGYQWLKNAANLTGQTSSNLVINSVGANDAASYAVIVTNSSGSVTSAPATLTVIMLNPVVTSQPSDQSVSYGQSAAFSVGASGQSPFSYQWRLSGTNLPGKTAGSLSISSATATDVGTYTVVVANAFGSVTSAPAALTVDLNPVIISQPVGFTLVSGQSSNLAVAVTGPSPFTYQWRLGGSDLAGKTSASLALNSATTNDAGSYTVVIANSFGSVTSAPAIVTVLSLPTITTQPTSRSNVIGTSFSFTVAVSSTSPVTYQWRKNAADLSNSAHLTGCQGSTLGVNAAQLVDSGNYSVVVANAAGSVTSQVAVLTVTPFVAAATVTINGAGSVSPNYNGQLLQLGTTYTMTATPDAGFTFANWTGSQKTNGTAITFVMKSNLVLHANFSFPFAKGAYHGLCYDPAGVTVSNGGAFNLTVSSAGNYSGALQMAGKKFGLSGKFNVFGTATNKITLSKSNIALVSLAIDSADKDRLTGSVSNAFWTVPLSSDRNTFSTLLNPAPEAGKYTLMIPGTSGSTTNPAGFSYGTLTVKADGTAAFAGALADGTKVSQASAISKDAVWPLFVQLYAGNGLVLGWQTFTNTLADDISGPVCWIKLAQPTAKYFPGGFAFIPPLSGSAYLAPTSGVPAINLPLGDLSLADGGLAQVYTNLITYLPSNKATNIAGVKLTLSVAPKTGVFTGTFINPERTNKVSISGVVLQKQNLGAGFFLSTNLSGQVYF